jgi:hypothetical protein
MISIKLSRPITEATSTTTPTLCSPNWSENYAHLEVVQNDDNGVVLQSTIAGHAILVDPQVISQIIGVPVLQISASPFNEVVFAPSLDSGSSFMLSHRARSELLLSGLVLCLPRTVCLPRSSSTISGLL